MALADLLEGLAVHHRIMREIAAAADDEEKFARDPGATKALDNDIVEGRAAGAEDELVAAEEAGLLAGDGDLAEEIEEPRHRRRIVLGRIAVDQSLEPLDAAQCQMRPGCLDGARAGTRRGEIAAAGAATRHAALEQHLQGPAGRRLARGGAALLDIGDGIDEAIEVETGVALDLIKH